MNEQFHAFLRSVVRCPAVRSRIDDIVVEFGNGLYQDISDRFFLNLEPVGFDELARMWRNTIGGRTYWDAPVYERFYRTVREVNESLPRRHRIRVLLGDVDIDWAEIRSVADADKLPGEDDRETYFYGVVEREVLAKGRRALFVCGGGHLRRGIHTTTTSDMDPPHDPRQPTVGTLLATNHPGAYYVIIPFAEANGANHTLPPDAYNRWFQTMSSWPVPSIGAVAGTWLASEPFPDRELQPGTTFQDQQDAVLWTGPDTALTCARADPALYRSGPYADELRRRSEVLTAITGNQIDLVAEGLHLAGLGPSCSER